MGHEVKRDSGGSGSIERLKDNLKVIDVGISVYLSRNVHCRGW